jgi:hypothetical protein
MSDLNTRQRIAIIGIAACVFLLFARGQGCSLPSISAKPTAAVFVYEKDLHVVPAPVQSAFNTLNRQGIVATLLEQDTVDGSGQTPEAYRVPLAAAKEAGLPALVVMAGERVLRTVKDPRTAEQVMEAVK